MPRRLRIESLPGRPGKSVSGGPEKPVVNVERGRLACRDGTKEDYKPQYGRNFHRADRTLDLLIRGEKVLLDRDLADLYQVETRVLIQAVNRNIGRFPTDFMFQLSTKELERWRSQFVMSNPAAKMGLRRRHAFTEQGVAMLSSVLHSERAVEVNIEIMRAFVRLRQLLASHEGLARKLPRPGEEVRRAVPSCFPRDPAVDLRRARAEKTADWIPIAGWTRKLKIVPQPCSLGGGR